jgi:site-specific DNA-methyltransferase (adenine-specific)
MGRVEKGPGWELRLGRWQDVLADVTECDAVITDPPYGERTHSKQFHGRRKSGGGNWATSAGLEYAHMSRDDATSMCAEWGGRTRAWFVAMTSHDLVSSYEHGAREANLTAFKPLPIVLKGMNVRLAGDGPSSWSVDMFVARTKAAHRWGTLPGAYVGMPFDGGQNSVSGQRAQVVRGAKPQWLMRAIVRDYSRPGDLIVDPYAGGGTTLLAAAMEGRRAIGAEVDPETFEKATKRLRQGIQGGLFD